MGRKIQQAPRGVEGKAETGNGNTCWSFVGRNRVAATVAARMGSVQSGMPKPSQRLEFAANQGVNRGLH